MEDRSRKSTKSPNTVQSLNRIRKEIQGELLNRLKASWGLEAKTKTKIDMLLREQRQQNDLFSALVQRLYGRKMRDETHGLKSVISRMRSEFFSTEDLFLEMIYLEEAVEETFRRAGQTCSDQTREVIPTVRMGLKSLMVTILRETIGVYEEIVKSGQRGFCLFDGKGKVVSTNPKMEGLLGTTSAVGKPLRSFLDAEGRLLLHKVVTDKAGADARLLRMRLISQRGKEKHVGVELAPMALPSQRRGGYFCAVDLTEAVRMETELYEHFPLGVIRLKLNGDFTYMNQVACNLLQVKHCDGLNVKSIVPDSSNLKTVKQKLKDRREGFSEQYPIEVCRLTDRRRLPVMIAATPERDLHGRVVGSLAIIRDLTAERAAENIHKYITSSAEARKKIESKNLRVSKFVTENPMLNDQTTLMLAAAALEVIDLLPFDLFIITRFSESMTHLRKFFFLYPTGQIESYVRWWQISDTLREIFQKKTSAVFYTKTEVIEDYKEFLNRPQNRKLRDLPEYKWILQEKFNSAMSNLVVHEGKLLASISLLSKKKKAFRESHARLFGNLPLGKVVMVAIQSEEKSAEDFRLRLIREIVDKCESVDQVARALVEGLGKGHLWDHIALYKIDEKKQQFRLLHQRNLRKATPLREPFTQQLTEGVLGYVYKTAKHVLVQDKPNDPRFRDIYLPSVPRMMSEFCLPIVIENKVRWLLNIEDSNINAFSVEEIKELSALIDEVRTLLDRIWVRHFLLTTLAKTSDLVFMTTPQGYIEYPNPEAVRQLEYTKEELAEIKLDEIIVEPDVVEVIYNSPDVRSMEANLKRKSGGVFPVLLSANMLPDEFGGNVLICKDLLLYKRVEKLEYLGKMYHEIAVQTETPLSLAFDWLQSLKALSGEKIVIDTLDKALRQLRKTEITYKRLALYDQGTGPLPYNEVVLSMSEIVAHIRSSFPIPETKKIVFQLNEPLPLIKGDLFQLSFCFESLLSFLLRHLPPEEKIQLNVSCVRDWVVTEIKGFLPRTTAKRAVRTAASVEVANTLAQMALGMEMIDQFVRNHKGEMKWRQGKGYEQIFHIRLPVPREETIT